jgi:hypothetical protein
MQMTVQTPLATLTFMCVVPNKIAVYVSKGEDSLLCMCTPGLASLEKVPQQR